MSEYSVAISNLTGDDPARNVESIKNAVITALQSSDETLRIRSTEYFNHTFAPDLVLRWDGVKEERQVFLRTNTNTQYLREDVEVISERMPILMPLSPLGNQIYAEELERESANARTLVTDPDSLHTFSTGRQKRPVLGLLSQAVLQGGRGLVDQRRARSTSDAVSRGFAAAQRAEPDPTRGAVEATEKLLDPSHADRLNRLLHAVWLGSGASPASFPGATGITPDLDAEGLKLLLEIAVSEDEEFWHRIGSGVSLSQLCNIDLPASSENLQRLVRANLDHFQAKSCRVSDNLTESQYGSEPRWFTHGGILGYTTGRYRALFSIGPISSMDFMEGIEDGSVDLPELLDRAASAGVTISELVLESATGAQIGYTASPLAQGSDAILEDLQGAFGQRTSVRAAVISLSPTRHIKCDLTKRAATGRTVAKIYLSEFMQSAIPLLRTLRRSEHGEILGLVGPLPEILPRVRLWSANETEE